MAECVWCESASADPHAYDPERLGLCFTCGKAYKDVATRDSKRIMLSFPLMVKKEAEKALKSAMEHFELAYRIERQHHSRGGKRHLYELAFG